MNGHSTDRHSVPQRSRPDTESWHGLVAANRRLRLHLALGNRVRLRCSEAARGPGRNRFSPGPGVRDGMATLAGQPPPDAARGAQAARVGAVVGLVSAVAPVALRLISSESPEASARVAGTVAFTLVYASPSLLALMASSVQSPGVRGGLLAAIVGLLALGAGFSIPSSVALLLLPPTFVLWFAAARSLAAARHPLRTSLPAVVVGLLIAAPAGFGFIALFAVQDDELRVLGRVRRGVLLRERRGHHHRGWPEYRCRRPVPPGHAVRLAPEMGEGRRCGQNRVALSTSMGRPEQPRIHRSSLPPDARGARSGQLWLRQSECTDEVASGTHRSRLPANGETADVRCPGMGAWRCLQLAATLGLPQRGNSSYRQNAHACIPEGHRIAPRQVRPSRPGAGRPGPAPLPSDGAAVGSRCQQRATDRSGEFLVGSL